LKKDVIFRREFKKKPQCIVVKIGSAGVSDRKLGILSGNIKKIVKDLVTLKQQGIDVLLVTSGAINVGKYLLNDQTPKSLHISYDQACASVGQPLLMAHYYKEFKKYQQTIAQVLLTHSDLGSSERHFNLSQAMQKILEKNVIPIINENDAVSFEEITLGDNDQLAAMVAQLVGADVLVLLTETDGVYDNDPKVKKDAQPIALVPYQSDLLKAIDTRGKTTAGKGGMSTKIIAAKKCSEIGIEVVIASYDKTRPLISALTKPLGTFFSSSQVSIAQQKKSRIYATAKKNVFIEVDQGAYNVLKKNASLLPVGIKNIQGQFKRGDSVALSFHGEIFAYGIVEFDSLDCLKILGKKSAEVKNLLPLAPASEVIHRDFLYLLSTQIC
jgi:glutamate 5-kinase